MTRFIILALAALVASAPAADAAVRKWVGTYDARWSVPVNWENAVVPVNGDTLHFPAGAPLSTYDDLTSLQWVDTIRVDDNYKMVYGFGNPTSLEVRGGVIVGPGVTSAVFAPTLTVAQPQTWTGGGAEFTVRITDSGATLTLSPDGAYSLAASGVGAILQRKGTVTVNFQGCAQPRLRTLGGELIQRGGGPTFVDVNGPPCTEDGCTTRVSFDGMASPLRITATGGAVRPVLPGVPSFTVTEKLTLGPGTRYEVPVSPVYGRRPADIFQVNGPRSPLHVGRSAPSCASTPVGEVTLNGATLEVVPVDRVAGCTTLMIIENDDFPTLDPVIGTFAGLPEGATFTTASGQLFRISYVGGTGNDVTITAIDGLPHCSIVASDLTGDRKSDILWRNSATGENALWSPRYDSTPEAFTRNALPQVPNDWQLVAANDFDGDGQSDLLWRHTAGDNYLWRMRDGAILDSGLVNTIPDANWRIAGTGDFDGDGTADILWRHAITGENYLYLMDGFTIQASGSLYPVTDMQWTIAGVGDLNGDGRDDIIWRHAGSGEIYAWLMNGLSVVWSGIINYVPDPNWTIIAVADFDADRQDDLLWRNSATGEIYLYLMEGLQIREYGPVATVPDLGWSIGATGDYDGDGRADLLWRHTNGSIYLYLMDGFKTVLPRGVGSLDPAWKAVR
ncbi:MAG TPA: VCBS repeat-containing protein [Thermoanaerobaculia bacterium]|nr:VCBS repeat-containing protein [Thermoanaerobaculia bacterium]